MNSKTPNETVENGASPEQPTGKFHTMHDDVESWTDVCSCEPEQRWQALAEELEQRRRHAQGTGAPGELPPQ